ncbi:hypothetical protein DFP72DRAFT_847775 [Ephemerocybe angulata]|uniref:Uncharacterized protein n=1 Tax=Ephemerocybe angulata TaxID=980116 RepID=A0A8H6HZL6_9AGAR|nr:hypothetical protein DFP72DRAFT_847775 [Tulosesus angulatus]
MRLSLIALIPLAAFFSVVHAQSDYTREAREHIDELATRAFEDVLLTTRQELADLSTRDLVNELKDRLQRRSDRYYCHRNQKRAKRGVTDVRGKINTPRRYLPPFVSTLDDTRPVLPVKYIEVPPEREKIKGTSSGIGQRAHRKGVDIIDPIHNCIACRAGCRVEIGEGLRHTGSEVRAYQRGAGKSRKQKVGKGDRERTTPLNDGAEARARSRQRSIRPNINYCTESAKARSPRYKSDSMGRKESTRQPVGLSWGTSTPPRILSPASTLVLVFVFAFGWARVGSRSVGWQYDAMRWEREAEAWVGLGCTFYRSFDVNGPGCAAFGSLPCVSCLARCMRVRWSGKTSSGVWWPHSSNRAPMDIPNLRPYHLTRADKLPGSPDCGVVHFRSSMRRIVVFVLWCFQLGVKRMVARSGMRGWIFAVLDDEAAVLSSGTVRVYVGMEAALEEEAGCRQCNLWVCYAWAFWVLCVRRPGYHRNSGKVDGITIGIPGASRVSAETRNSTTFN